MALALVRWIPTARSIYRVGLLCGGGGLILGFWRQPAVLPDLHGGCVGIGWATVLAMPYAMLANAIPATRMGFYMGVFNFFIVLPQILAATVLGPVVGHVFGGQAMPAVMVGGVSFLLAAAALSMVPR